MSRRKYWGHRQDRQSGAEIVDNFYSTACMQPLGLLKCLYPFVFIRQDIVGTMHAYIQLRS